VDVRAKTVPTQHFAELTLDAGEVVTLEMFIES